MSVYNCQTVADNPCTKSTNSNDCFSQTYCEWSYENKTCSLPNNFCKSDKDPCPEYYCLEQSVICVANDYCTGVNKPNTSSCSANFGCKFTPATSCTNKINCSIINELDTC